MSVAVTDLLDPVGDIDPSMFPSDDLAGLQVRVGQYLARALAVLADSPAIADARVSDAATKAYVYYLANNAVYRRLSSQPLTMTLTDAGSRTRSQAQIEHFSVKANDYYQQFNDLVPSPLVPPTTVSRVTSAPTRATW